MISLGRETMTYKFYNSVFLSHGLDLSPDTEAATADPFSYTHLDVYKRQATDSPKTTCDDHQQLLIELFY